MQNSKEPKKIIHNVPVKIIQIAYQQLNEMYGMDNPCIKDTKDYGVMVETNTFVFTRRLFQMPMFTTFSTTVSDIYNKMKQSNDVITSIFTTTEKGFEQGAKLVEPMTHKIGNTLETPLKFVDSIVCHGLDYLEETMPSITESCQILLTNIGNFCRSSTIAFSTFFLNDSKSIYPLSIKDGNDKKQKTTKIE